MRPYPLLISILLAPIGFSCHETNNQNSKAVKEEMRSREIVHATPGQIAQRATEMGDSLIEQAENRWKLAREENQIKPCSSLFSQVQAEIKGKFQSDVQLLLFENNPLQSTRSQTEREVIDAYLYNRENGISIEANLQKDGEKEFLYTSPFILTKGMETCFYNSSAHNVGDTVGVWSVRMLKKNIILSFVEKY